MVAVLLCTALLWVALDQSAKWLVAARAVHHVSNPRSGLVQVSDPVAIVLWVVAVACAATVVAWRPDLLTSLGLGLSVGGASGNLIDRLARGRVIDFIGIGRWPTFNLADAALVMGVAVVAISLL